MCNNVLGGSLQRSNQSSPLSVVHLYASISGWVSSRSGSRPQSQPKTKHQESFSIKSTTLNNVTHSEYILVATSVNKFTPYKLGVNHK